MRHEIIEGDCREVMAGMDADSIDAVVCDPPYDLTSASRKGSPRRRGNGPAGRHRVGEASGGFMGKTWDATGIAFDPETWRAALRVLKPGGHLLAFGGTRTHHRLICAIEDAGFEIRDVLSWVYGSGFPKSLDVSKAIYGLKRGNSRYSGRHADQTKDVSIPGKQLQEAANRTMSEKKNAWSGKQIQISSDSEAIRWQGWGTALKPAYEPIVLARKPISERNVAANVLRWGTGGINVDGCRIGIADWGYRSPRTPNHILGQGKGTNLTSSQAPQGKGRWPANLILSHDPRCVQVGTEPDPGYKINSYPDGAKPFGGGAGHEYETTEVAGGEREVWACVAGCPFRMLDEQSGRSQTKASPRDTSKTQAGDPVNFLGKGGWKSGAHFGDSGGASRFFYVAKASSSERVLGCPPGFRNSHPTVKPLALMRWLVRLVTPPGGLVLDPFAGSGTTVVACALEGFGAVGVEMEAESVECARGRLITVEKYGEKLTSLKRFKLKKRKRLKLRRKT